MLVLPHARVLAWPAPASMPRAARRADAGEVLTPEHALTRAHASDAHCVAYSASGTYARRRLSTAAAGRVAIEVRWLLIDLDGPDHQSTPAWRDDTHRRIQAVERVHPGAVFYATRGGMRLIWRLATPFAITADASSARDWSRRYVTIVGYLRRAFGLEADPACRDWTRLHRLPFVIRDGERTHGILNGEPGAIGAFDFSPTDHDHEAARELAPSLWREGRHALEGNGAAWHARPAHGLNAAPSSHAAHMPEAAGHMPEPLLLAACRARDLVIREQAPGVWAITCPREHMHTSPGGAVLFANAGGVGRISCRHAHCAEVDHAGWLAALGLDRTTASRLIAACYPNDGERIRVAFDDGSDLRISVTNAARWAALWQAAGVEPPADNDPAGDLGAACAELVGRRLKLVHEGGRVAGIEGAPPAAPEHEGAA